MISLEAYVLFLKKTVTWVVIILALLMTFIIMWSAFDVFHVVYQQIFLEPNLRLETEHLMSIFGSFLTVLIGIEIFANIIVYLTENVFHEKLVAATALTAVLRKVIILDYSLAYIHLIYAVAAAVLAVALAYWLVSRAKDRTKPK